jgi:hypothetical protein
VFCAVTFFFIRMLQTPSEALKDIRELMDNCHWIDPAVPKWLEFEYQRCVSPVRFMWSAHYQRILLLTRRQVYRRYRATTAA